MVTRVLAGIFVAISAAFVYRSFHGMRIESARAAERATASTSSAA